MKSGVSNRGCYLAHLGACDGPLSREHLVSEAVLNVIIGDGLKVSGLPWIPRGESRMLPANALVARCLCKEHNSALSDLDTEAGRFFAAIKGMDQSEPPGEHLYVASGHDIERWLLKTMAAMAFSENFAHQGGRLGSHLVEGLNLAEMLEDPRAWRPGAGLYAVNRIGHRFARKDEVSLMPVFRGDTGQIAALYVEAQGVRFDFYPLPPAEIGMAPPEFGYRLSGIRALHGRAEHVLTFSWLDGRHGHLVLAADGMGPG